MGTATGALSAWDRISSWMGGLSSVVDAILRPIVQPLADLFDSVTGDADQVRTTAQRWRDLARTLRSLRDHERSVLRGVVPEWSGEASEAFEARITELLKGMEAFAAELDATGEFLEDAAMEVEVAEQLVEDIIRELIEFVVLMILTGLALSWLSAGASVAAAALSSAAKGAVAYARIAAIVAKVAIALQRLSVLLKTSMVVKGLAGLLVVKPVLRTVTGFTGSPVDAIGGGVRALRDIAADEFDDQRSGDTDVQTPLRNAIDDYVGPVADRLDPLLDRVDPFLDPILEYAENVPQRPLS